MYFRKQMKYVKILLVFFLLINSCNYPEISRDELIFNNNFESEDLSEIESLLDASEYKTLIGG